MTHTRGAAGILVIAIAGAAAAVVGWIGVARMESNARTAYQLRGYRLEGTTLRAPANSTQAVLGLSVAQAAAEQSGVAYYIARGLALGGMATAAGAGLSYMVDASSGDDSGTRIDSGGGNIYYADGDSNTQGDRDSHDYHGGTDSHDQSTDTGGAK